MSWVLIPDFDHLSLYLGKCPVTGGIKKDGDPGVLRGPDIDGAGCLDLSYEAARDMVLAIGGLPPEDAERIQKELEALRDEHKRLLSRNAELEHVLSAVKRASERAERTVEAKK